MKSSAQSQKYLADFLKIAPLSHALWRSVEAIAYSKINIQGPTLDVGCGFGEFAGVVFDTMEMGIDINKKELEIAGKGKKYKKVLFADAKRMPFKNNTFENVISVSVLEHIPKVEKTIPEMHRVLKRGGLFVFSVPTDSLSRHLMGTEILERIGQKALAKKYFELHSKAFKHVSLKSKAWWKNKLKENDFEIIQMHGTISVTLLRLHELFLPFSLPSQIAKLLTGNRLIVLPYLRSSLLSNIFYRFILLDEESDINIFIVAKKK
jgi:ubiquinone/menaquinone biosynthesis C-methylase UbiE